MPGAALGWHWDEAMNLRENSRTSRTSRGFHSGREAGEVCICNVMGGDKCRVVRGSPCAGQVPLCCWTVEVSFSDQVKFEQMPEVGEAASQADIREKCFKQKEEKAQRPEFLGIQETARKSVVAGMR